MIVVISPAKSLYDKPPIQLKTYSEADFLPEAEKIVSVMKKKKTSTTGHVNEYFAQVG